MKRNSNLHLLPILTSHQKYSGEHEGEKKKNKLLTPRKLFQTESESEARYSFFFLKKDLWTDRKKWMRIIYINNMWQTQGEVTTDWGQFNFKGLERYSRQLSSLVPWESDWWPLYILGAKFQCEVIDILIIYLGKDPEPFPRNYILKWAGAVYFSRMETSSDSKGKRSKTVICLIDFFPKPLWHEYVPDRQGRGYGYTTLPRQCQCQRTKSAKSLLPPLSMLCFSLGSFSPYGLDSYIVYHSLHLAKILYNYHQLVSILWTSLYVYQVSIYLTICTLALKFKVLHPKKILQYTLLEFSN